MATNLPAWAVVMVAFFAIVPPTLAGVAALIKAWRAQIAIEENTRLTERLGDFIADEVASIANGRNHADVSHDPPRA